MKTLFLAVLALVANGAAPAASLLVKPTTVMLSRGASAAAITVTNSGDTPVTAQVRVFAWDQSSNEDQLNQTTALAASPPMMTIAAGQSQVIRLVRVATALAQREETYRVLVDEIAERAAATTPGVAIQLRYSVPVFVMPRPRDTANLSLKAEMASDELLIDAANRGQAHAQVSNVSLAYADGSSIVVGAGLIGYVLPDKSRQWRLRLPARAPNQGQPQSVRAVVNGQELVVAL
ncbi:MAG TPA: fimbria/pilus periplasmic chaperone [Gammaproteobacteria bacterium]|nr:fimbria/pilus periplasmic chaperone [Gammaproteobacteria bacterium]